MSGYHRCPKCASSKMIDGAYIGTADGPRVVVGVDRHPDRGPLERPMSTGIHATVCGSCGYVDLYANQPAELHDAYLRAVRSSRRAPASS